MHSWHAWRREKKTHHWALTSAHNRMYVKNIPLTWITTTSPTRTKVGKCIWNVTVSEICPGSLVCRACRGSSSAYWQVELHQEIHVAHSHIFMHAASISLAFQTVLGCFAVRVTAPRLSRLNPLSIPASWGKGWCCWCWLSSSVDRGRLATRQ